jgi:hypothetical protein
MKPMKKPKETAIAILRAFPSTHRKLKVEAAKRGITIAELLDLLTKDIKN